MALLPFPHRALQVAQVLAAQRSNYILPHEVLNIACKQSATIVAQISLFKKS
jgi:hypothetical protein